MCPSDPTNFDKLGPRASYGVNGQAFFAAYPGGWGQLHRFPSYISDGTSNTIAYTEKEVQSYGFTGWAPDGGYGTIADWGPVIASVESGSRSATMRAKTRAIDSDP